MEDDPINPNALLACSFCGHKTNDIEFLLEGIAGHICDLCITQANNALGVYNVSKSSGNNLNMPALGLPTPKEIKEYLDLYVVGQDEAKRSLSVAVYNHYKRIYLHACNSPIKQRKSNIIMLGPTGSGKTLLIEHLATKLNVPYAATDATSLTTVGYHGDDPDVVLQRLLERCDYKVAQAERGIIYIDEIDKIAQHHGRHESSAESVQQDLLRLMEGTTHLMADKGRDFSRGKSLSINTENILFIFGGAFTGLDSIIAKRTNSEITSGIGFNSPVGVKKDQNKVGSILKNTTAEDLISYGFIREFIGRIPVITSIDNLTEETLLKILQEPKDSILSQYTELFRLENVSLEVGLEALKVIAAKAFEAGLGARGLRGLLEKIFERVMFDVPSDPTITRVVITEKAAKGLEEPILIRGGKNNDVSS